MLKIFKTKQEPKVSKPNQDSKNSKANQEPKVSKANQEPKGLKTHQKPKSFSIKSVLNFNRFGFFKKKKLSPRNPADYIKKIVKTTPVELVSDAIEQKDLVISTAYKQVFGNVHLMESERFLAAESQLRSGQITVMDFIRQLAKSERYRALVFEKNSNLRAVELNFKHLLGRAPESHAEVSEHIARLTNEGYDAEIDSYLNSDEYFRAFGTDIVPYYRGYQTQTGRKLAGYTNSFQLEQGGSSSDISTPASSYIKLDKSLLDSDAITVLLDNIDISEKIAELSQSPRAKQPAGSKYGPRILASPATYKYAYSPEPEDIIRKALNLPSPNQNLPIDKNNTTSS
ncbi:MAG: phycobilisome rod-core linker polypeptide [Cyanobacteria bacterium P01_F01_bin.116]